MADIVPEFISVFIMLSFLILKLSPTDIVPELVRVPIVPPEVTLIPLSFAADIVPELVKDVITPPLLIP